MNKIIKFHCLNDKVISINLNKENEDVSKIVEHKWFINIEPTKIICINLDKVIFMEICDE